jgi:hypothetical protein
LPADRGQGDNFDTGRRRTTRALRRDQQTPDTGIGEHPGVGAKPGLRIDDDFAGRPTPSDCGKMAQASAQ